ncbi:Hypothetical protein GbCGDNIH2_5028 [Granulibacter bethesdensis]|uniref:Uncharacterized protein n=2 Tax=Granulibacter bethesdensis TaxID=364410 RepID=A0A286M2Y0_GRABC|nr:Hypothetical protein GbCGDNIH3_5028 [Granulibacter bethesdensis]AHJ65095.1 Hypothetical protein GbCGDNIH4_5028 [Granulibacter bethesdensis CGDNIH4]ASV62379.1 Hypothetical protein GbCGDNIH1_5028 [Granulibacter bethesdensis CGDNIH1]AHJ67718.1 Hypothetical protein GbCGDNIH2_5028 [Granulibacter bethesdensis]APH51381.1 Hypothetical protein GbCGDNIH5_5028 [Granulibacter bethesdensis]
MVSVNAAVPPNHPNGLAGACQVPAQHIARVIAAIILIKSLFIFSLMLAKQKSFD